MSRSLNHTIIRRTQHGIWRATRMCGDIELYHEDGETWEIARAKMRERVIPEIVKQVFEEKSQIVVDGSMEI